MAKLNRAGNGPRPTDEEIGERAYALYLENGSRSGHEVEDWLQAEAELTAAAGDAEASTAPAQARRSEAASGRRETSANSRRSLRS